MPCFEVHAYGVLKRVTSVSACQFKEAFKLCPWVPSGGENTRRCVRSNSPRQRRRTSQKIESGPTNRCSLGHPPARCLRWVHWSRRQSSQASAPCKNNRPYSCGAQNWPIQTGASPRLLPLAKPNRTQKAVTVALEQPDGSQSPSKVATQSEIVKMITLKRPILSARKPRRNLPKTESALSKDKTVKFSEVLNPCAIAYETM